MTATCADCGYPLGVAAIEGLTHQPPAPLFADPPTTIDVRQVVVVARPAQRHTATASTTPGGSELQKRAARVPPVLKISLPDVQIWLPHLGAWTCGRQLRAARRARHVDASDRARRPALIPSVPGR